MSPLERYGRELQVHENDYPEIAPSLRTIREVLEMLSKFRKDAEGRENDLLREV